MVTVTLTWERKRLLGLLARLTMLTIRWPGVFAVALKKAGWDLSKSIPVPEALQAITGLKPAIFYDRSNASANVTNGTFKDVVLKPIRSNESPLVVQTRNQSFHDLKANYAYALYVSQTIFKEDNKNE